MEIQHWLTFMHSWSVMEESIADISQRHYSVWIFSILLTNDKTIKPRALKSVMYMMKTWVLNKKWTWWKDVLNRLSQDSNSYNYICS